MHAQGYGCGFKDHSILKSLIPFVQFVPPCDAYTLNPNASGLWCDLNSLVNVPLPLSLRPAAGRGAILSPSATCLSLLPLTLQLGVGVWPAGRPGSTCRMAPLRRLLLRLRLSRLTHP